MRVDRIATEQALYAKQKELIIAKSTFPLVPKTIIELQSKVASHEAGLKALDDLAKELGLRDQDLIKP